MNTTLQSRNVLMGIVRIALILFFATHLFSSCTDEQTDNPTPNGEEKMITFSVKVPGGFTPATYALDADDENAVETIDVLLFDENGDYLSGPHYGAISGSDVTIRIPESDANYDMVVLANCRKEVNATTLSGTKGTILSALTLSLPISGWITGTDDDAYRAIPMWAETAVSVTGSTATVTYPADKDAIELVRMLARINVEVDEDAPFKLTHVYLCNYNDAGYIAPTLPIADPNKTGFSNAIPYTTFDVSGNCINEIYTFEAATAAAYDVDNPCLVIGGTYNGETYYYRVDFVKKTTDAGVDTYTYLDLQRNHKYEVNIESISGPGYANADKALASRPINVEYEIKDWNEGAVSDVVYDGQYMLGVSQKSLTFNKYATVAALVIQTDNPLGWTAKVFEGSSDKTEESSFWLQISNKRGYSGESGTVVTVAANEDSGASERTATIELTAGNLKYVLTVTQTEEATITPLPVIIPMPSEIYYLDGKEYSFKIYADTPFTIEYSDSKIASMAYNAASVDANGEEIEVTFTTSLDLTGTGDVHSIPLTFKSSDGTSTLREFTLNTTTPKPEPEANSYIVKSGQTIFIPVSQINNFKRDLIKLTDNSDQPIAADTDAADAWFDDDEAFTTGWIWKEFSGMTVTPEVIGTGIDGFIKVTVSSATPGNAVVAAIQDELIRWSWHLWVVDGSDIPSVFPGSPFMDRNLGALNKTVGDAGSKGLYYQWGRKDPFPTTSTDAAWTASPATNESTVDAIYNTEVIDGLSKAFSKNVVDKLGIVADISTLASDFKPATRLNGTANNVDYTVANPHTFYHRGSSNLYDWYIFSSTPDAEDATSRWLQNNNLWGGYLSELSYKTAFDPCPPGWRTPQSSILGTGGYGANGFEWTTNNASPWSGASRENNIFSPTVAGDYTTILPDKKGYSWDGTSFEDPANTENTITSPNLGGWYPASGARDSSNGNVGNVGPYGYYWSASPSAATGNRRAGHLNFSSGSVNPAVGNSRSSGLSVRCVQE